MISTVLFDLYGTLIAIQRDSRPYHKLIKQLPTANTRELLRKSLVHPCESLLDFATLIKQPVPDNIDALETDLKQDIESAALFEDSLPTLIKLKERGIKIGLVSNLATPYKLPVQNFGLQKYFDLIIFYCDEGVAKPEARIYELALNRLNSSASETLMIGDSYKSDVVGASNVGITGILLDRANHRNSNSTEISGLSEILETI